MPVDKIESKGTGEDKDMGSIGHGIRRLDQVHDNSQMRGT